MWLRIQKSQIETHSKEARTEVIKIPWHVSYVPLENILKKEARKNAPSQTKITEDKAKAKRKMLDDNLD